MGMSTTTTDEGPIADEDVDEFLGIYRPDSTRPRPEWIDSDDFPRTSNLSAAFIYGDVMVKAEEPTRAEYVTVPMLRVRP